MSANYRRQVEYSQTIKNKVTLTLSEYQTPTSNSNSINRSPTKCRPNRFYYLGVSPHPVAKIALISGEHRFKWGQISSQLSSPKVWSILYGLIRGVISGLVFKGHQYVRPYHVCKLGGDLELTFKQISNS